MIRPSRAFFLLLVCVLAPLARAGEPAAWSHIVAFGDSLSWGGRGKGYLSAATVHSATAPKRATPAPTVQPATTDDPAAAAFIAHIRQLVATRPTLRRPQSLAELAAIPSFQMKYREKPAHLAKLDEAGWERFALSLADAEAAKSILQLLPAVATAARLSDDPALLAYVRDQLAEVATWTPLQRAGWSGGSATPGAWLGTGWTVRAIVQTLVQLPENALTPELRAQLVARLESEIAGIREDWRTRRTWFARTEAVSSNQWVLPLEALALASLFSGLDQHRDDFEFAVAGLLRSLDAQGRAGECVEGMQYGGITYDSLLSVALVARSFGDERLFKHPWLQQFPAWYLHHRQPGGFVINAFDSNPTDLDWTLIARIAAELADPAARWVLAQRPATLPPSPALELALLKIARSTAPNLVRPPALFAAYPVAARVNWLESTAAFASGPANRVSGFWLRGGHESDAHDHQDRGHVNFIVAGRPVLIEAGLSSYGIPDHPTHYKSVAGHNVLQVGAFPPAALSPEALAAGAGQILDPAHRAAPLTVHRLESAGGEVSVDASRCYAGVKRWIRTATWDAHTVTIRDEVELAQPDTMIFRWHLGEPADASVTHHGPGQLSVGRIVLAYETVGTPLHANIEPMPDHTLHPGKVSQHATVVLQTEQPVQKITLTTRVSLASAATPLSRNNSVEPRMDTKKHE